jgi:DNA-directed RNA polymerase specialized sigma24 family protein
MTNEMLIRNSVKEDTAAFQVRFFRCRRLLHFIATRVLGDSDRAEDAIENCWLSAFRNPPRFEYESAFRSWLLRVLMDEALALRRQGGETSEPKTPVERIPSQGIAWDRMRDAVGAAHH